MNLSKQLSIAIKVEFLTFHVFSFSSKLQYNCTFSLPFPPSHVPPSSPTEPSSSHPPLILPSCLDFPISICSITHTSSCAAGLVIPTSGPPSLSPVLMFILSGCLSLTFDMTHGALLKAKHDALSNRTFGVMLRIDSIRNYPNY